MEGQYSFQGMYTQTQQDAYEENYHNHCAEITTKFDVIKKEIQNMDLDAEKFKNQKLPLARVKKIMKADEDVRMISAEAPVLFAKACEMFIIEMTHKAYFHTVENKRRTLQREDIAQCIVKNDLFDFLIDVIPKDDIIKYSSVSNGKANFPPNNVYAIIQDELLKQLYSQRYMQRAPFMQQVGGDEQTQIQAWQHFQQQMMMGMPEKAEEEKKN